MTNLIPPQLLSHQRSLKQCLWAPKQLQIEWKDYRKTYIEKKKSSYNSCLILIDSISLKKKKKKKKEKEKERERKKQKNFLKRGWVAQLIIHLSLSTYLSNLSKRVTNFGISPELKQNNMAINKHYWSSNGNDSALQRSIEKGLPYVNHIINCTILRPL